MNPASLIANADFLQKALCERSLHAFLRYAWSSMDPADFIDGWYLKLICDTLEKVYTGEIRNLVINIPPRHSKSLVASVAFPAWCWIKDPSTQFISTSYAAALSIRDSVKMRRLIESPWFKGYWGDKVQLVKDQNQKQFFATTSGGHRFSTSVGGLLTGFGAEIIICDDGHNVIDGESEPTRTTAVEWWREAVPTRLNNPKTGKKIVIQQRVHANDIAGWCIKNGYHCLVLPAEYEPDHPFVSPYDKRTRPGELLCPERFGREEIEELKRSMGSYASAGQLQQRPAPREGGMFKRHWFDIVPAAPAKAERWRHWDLAATAESQGEDPDYTCGVKIAKDEHGVFYVEDIRRMRESSLNVEKAMMNTARQDGARVKISIPQDPGAAGKSLAAYYVRQLAGYVVKADPETGSKETRAGPLAAQAEAGNVKLVQGDWNDAFLNELASFPNGAHDDQVDAASGAFARMITKNTTGVLDFYKSQVAAVQANMEHGHVSGTC